MGFRGSGLVRYTAPFDGQRVDEDRGMAGLPYVSAYKEKPRIVEAHDYGIHRGSVKLLSYQVGGSSSGRLPNWR